MLAGVLLLLASTRVAGVVGGWLGVAAGAWFVVGPAVSLTWEHNAGPIGRPLFGSTRQALELIGCFYGLGALIVALSAFAVGRFASRARLVEEAPLVAVETAPAGVARGERLAPSAAPVAETEPLAAARPHASERRRRGRAFGLPLRGRRAHSASGGERGREAERDAMPEETSR